MKRHIRAVDFALSETCRSCFTSSCLGCPILELKERQDKVKQNLKPVLKSARIKKGSYQTP